jgi:hypothetical protein
LVSASPVSALSTAASALYIDASAEAMLLADGVVLIAPVDEDALEPVALGVAVLVDGVVVVVGVVDGVVAVVGVVLVVGVVVVVVGVVVVGVVVVGVVVVGVVAVVGVVDGVVAVVGVVVVVVGVVVVLRVLLASVTSETNSVLSEPVARSFVSLVSVPDELEDVPSSAAVSSSLAAARLRLAWWRVSHSEVELSEASSCPFCTRCPVCTYTCARTPLSLKFTSRSVLGSTFPEPVTVDCATPFCAVTTSCEVRAELDGAPICSTPAVTITTATSARTMMYHGRGRRALTDVSLLCSGGSWPYCGRRVLGLTETSLGTC